MNGADLIRCCHEELLAQLVTEISDHIPGFNDGIEVNDRAAAFGLPLDAAQETAEVVIDWSDQISIAFSEGFNDETAARAGELETHRQQLLRTVLTDPAPSPKILARSRISSCRSTPGSPTRDDPRQLPRPSAFTPTRSPTA